MSATTLDASPPATPHAAPSRGRRRKRVVLRYLAGRLLRLISILFGVTLLSFFLIKLTPGDPVATSLGPQATPEQVDELRAELGLDRPIWDQYVSWLSGVFRGDFGTTLSAPARSVSGELAARLPVTLELAFLAIVLSLAIAVPVAIWSAYRQGQRFDRTVSGVLYGLIAIPGFVAALLLVLLFVFNPDTARTAGLAAGTIGAVVALIAAWRVRRTGRSPKPALVSAGAVFVVGVAVFAFLPDLPRQGFVPISEGLGANLQSVALPVLALTFVDVAVFTRLLRGDMVTELAKPYILSSRAKGMSTSHVLVREALKPSLFSLITVVGLTIGQLIGGTIIVEQIFRLPGIGSILVASIRNGDYPMVQACIFVIASVYVVLNALIDISYSYLDPRVRQVNPR